jgi:PAS domain S-box-containing protein
LTQSRGRWHLRCLVCRSPMKLIPINRLRYLTGLWVVGAGTLALATWICFQAGLNATTTAFVYLVVVVALSWFDSFVSSVLFSVAAVGCLNYFFVPPIFSFAVADLQDIVMLVTFVFTSFTVTSLVRRAHQLAGMRADQARLLDLTRDPILVFDTEDRVTYWNRGAERLYGWSKEEAVGRVVYELLQTVFPEPREQIIATLHSTERWEGELRQTARDGSVRFAMSHCTLERDQTGRPVGTLVAISDITARKRAEEALRRTQETYLAEAQRLSHTGSFGWNVTTGEIFWSDETYRIFGYAPSIKPRQGMAYARMHPEDAGLVRRIIEDAARHNTDFDCEYRLMMPDGSVKHLHVVARATKDDAGNLQFIGAVMDITARKLNEEDLRQSEERYRYLFEHMPIALWSGSTDKNRAILSDVHNRGVTDIGAYIDEHPELLQQLINNAQVTEVNRHAVQLFGADTREELLGSALAAQFWRTSPQTFRRLVEARFNGKTDFESEVKFTRLDGQTIQGLLFVTPYPSTFRTPSMALAGFVDDTDRLLAQEKLHQVQSEFARAARISTLGEMTGSIAHEINQPLTAIATNSDTALRWLDRPEPNVAKARELTQRIVEEARRAAAVITRVRAMASGRVPQLTTLSLHDVINDAIALLSSEIRGANASISLDLLPTLPKVRGDHIQLQQVVVNLVINAAQAMANADAARRAISIQTMMIDERNIGCAVQDSGPGIDPQHFNRLFDSFYTTKDSGMGLGLPLSRSIIEAHYGELRADNNSSLGGARFSFTLPVDANLPS